MNEIYNGLVIPKTLIFKDFEAMSLECARLVQKCVLNKPDALLCLPAGNSAIRTYERLREMKVLGDVDFRNARFVALDEWLDLEDERGNCRAFMNKHFYEPLGISEKQIENFRIHENDLAAECGRMDKFIWERGPIDLMLLGLGMNGHLGLNEPGVSWDRWTVAVELDPITASVGQKYFKQQVKLTKGITLGMKHMFLAKQVVLQVGEQKKAEIVKKMYSGGLSFCLPATVLKLIPGSLVLLDSDAASLLDEETLKYCVIASDKK